ncbi:MAG: DegT/DnrJ/EryC1/StrS family aminotransferase [Elusimicrobiota bacterium]
MSATKISIPVFDLKSQYASLRDELAQTAARVMDSGRYILGPEVQAFEAEFAAASGAKYCAGMASGTVALELALEACGIGPGDEVAVPSFSFIATATCVSSRGARPIFVDVDPGTLTMDPEDLRQRVTSRTKAVIPVHLFGRPADMDGIQAALPKPDIRIIEDCAQAHLARYRGRPVGIIGDAGAFSFYPSKNIGAFGDAGAVLTDNKELHARLSTLSNCGRRAGHQYDHACVGYNARLDELQAAFLRVKLRRLEEWTAARGALCGLYRTLLADTPLRLPSKTDSDSRDACHLFVVQCDRRDALQKHLADAGIGTGIYYPKPIHLQTAYVAPERKPEVLAVSERAAREVLALPLFPELAPADVEKVAAEIRRFFGK